MNKTIRNIGIGLFLAGAAFQIEEIVEKEEITSTSTITEDDYEQAQQELTEVKKQLAELQLDLNTAQQDQTNATDKVVETATTEQTPTVASMTLSVEVGMASSEISAQLAEAGIILNKVDMDNYLSDQGLAERIQIGNYELNSSMSLKQIAETITR
ncbi:hypothetical protein SAMN04487786_1856 [Paenisporosarcina quisquiliarum]|uniref:hypothetical protein n=1 Tax=Psychrobacillus TaxID=1221880 RepID=UPI0008BB547A|nr:hypothetical protein [Psychrobacillus psychrodurans]MCK1999010.1 endolytic transglycosylase MltG [Psychrobacillus psychrodurans]MCZ8542347.1 endolytic transglycosylase MltG [Psychrobacillus psychrodurans]SEM46049.1 hypothetical protein SAMN04487786_1856 [Paenisporosarcina quisquiliarum]SFN20762.1 hypothetical protein SAMN05421832_1211 [Psychrobacillus psychrodurans]